MSAKSNKKTLRNKYVRLASELTLEDLKQLEAEGPPLIERPEALPLKDIHIAPLVFQWRPENEELAAEEQLMTDLVRFIEGDDPPRALDPLVVTAIGKQFFVIDGHHRLYAYRTARWKGPVPVRHFNGTLKEAEAAALRYNFKNKLPMTQNAKSEAAWRMTLAGAKDPAWARTRKEIMRASGVGRSTVKRMAIALRRLGSEALEMTWTDVRKLSFQRELHEMGDKARKDWKEEKAREMADYLIKGPSLIQDPEITARALEMVSRLLPGQLTSEWPAEARENLTAAVQELVPDKL
jgi:ParB/Sulfiredoxin domain